MVVSRAPAYRIEELAERFGLKRRGDGDAVIRGVATLPGARGDRLAFLATPRYLRALRGTRAGVVAQRQRQHRCFLPCRIRRCDRGWRGAPPALRRGSGVRGRRAIETGRARDPGYTRYARQACA